MGRLSNILIRRGTEQAWSAANPILDSGEFGLDTTNNLLKAGNGIDNWSDLSPLACDPIDLATDSDLMNVMAIRSPLVNFKITGDSSIFTVPNGYVFFINAMDVITDNVTSPRTAPFFRFGNSESRDVYCQETQSKSNSNGLRHSIQSSQNATISGSIVSFGITTGSTASSHEGYAVVKGYLVKTTIQIDSSSSSSSSSSVSSSSSSSSSVVSSSSSVVSSSSSTIASSSSTIASSSSTIASSSTTVAISSSTVSSSSSVCLNPITLSLDSTISSYTNTGLWFVGGQPFSLNISGAVQWNGAASGYFPIESGLEVWGRFGPDAPEDFRVNTANYNGAAARSGYLFLVVNDSLYVDNAGSYTVLVCGDSGTVASSSSAVASSSSTVASSSSTVESSSTTVAISSSSSSSSSSASGCLLGPSVSFSAKCLGDGTVELRWKPNYVSGTYPDSPTTIEYTLDGGSNWIFAGFTCDDPKTKCPSGSCADTVVTIPEPSPTSVYSVSEGLFYLPANFGYRVGCHHNPNWDLKCVHVAYDPVGICLTGGSPELWSGGYPYADVPPWSFYYSCDSSSSSSSSTVSSSSSSSSSSTVSSSSSTASSSSSTASSSSSTVSSSSSTVSSSSSSSKSSSSSGSSSSGDSSSSGNSSSSGCSDPNQEICNGNCVNKCSSGLIRGQNCDCICPPLDVPYCPCGAVETTDANGCSVYTCSECPASSTDPYPPYSSLLNSIKTIFWEDFN